MDLTFQLLIDHAVCFTVNITGQEIQFVVICVESTKATTKCISTSETYFYDMMSIPEYVVVLVYL